MEVTVVIPTFNRYSRLQETLSALGDQDFKAFRVIVVNDGSTEKAYEYLNDFCLGLPYSCTVIQQENAGASAATNSGVRHAKDGLIVLFDDDILPSRSCIQQHIRFHDVHLNAILSGSADSDPDRSVTDVQRYKLYMEATWRKLRPDTEQLTKVGYDNFIITTANMSMQRKVFLDTGGFDIALRDGYDVDFGFRALMKGYSLYFDRNVRTIHNDQISLRYYAGRQRAYTESKRRIVEQHPELQEKFKAETERNVSGLKRMVYSVLRVPLFVDLFESRAFRWMLPRALRYKIYGSTIASLSQSR